MQRFCLFVLLTAATCLSGTAVGTFHFDSEPLGSLTGKAWQQSKEDNFIPFGKVEVVKDPFDTFEHALEITSSTRSTDVVTLDEIPVKLGECLRIDVAFKGEAGTTARVGIYGLVAKKISEYQAQEFTPCASGCWDLRQAVFEIKEPETDKVRIFVAAKANQRQHYSMVKVEKLSEEEAKHYGAGDRIAWRKASEGSNLAAGKSVTFFPKPNYELTSKNGSDKEDLTDGKLAPDSMLWFHPESVAWYRATNGVTLIVDLEKVQPISKGLIRLVGGRLGKSPEFPRELELWVSHDGSKFYRAAGLRKVAVTECELSDWKQLYYLPESENNQAITYVHTFELPVMADARYLAFRAPIYTPLMMISDELAVIKAEAKECQAPAYNAVYNSNPELLVHQEILIKPRMGKFYVAKDFFLPNWLQIDNRMDSEKVKSFSYTIDFPEGIDFYPDNSWPAYTRTFSKKESKEGRTIYYFEPSVKFPLFTDITKQYGLGPFYFSAQNTVPAPNQYVVFTTFVNGKMSMTHKLPMELLDFPEVAKFNKLEIGLAWTDNRFREFFPDYVKTHFRIGFNMMPLFPQARDAERGRKLYEEAKKAGMKIRLQLSPTAMEHALSKKSPEFRCMGATTSKTSACPAYRGKIYQQMLGRIKKAVMDFPADAITFDEESWEPTQFKECLQCERCDALRQSKNMTWAEYLEWVQADYLKEFAKAVREAAAEAGIPVPSIGFYALQPLFGYGSPVGKIPFLGYRFLYPEYCDEIQPSFYGRDSAECHKFMRKAIASSGAKPEKVIPWITGGAGAYHEYAIPARTGHYLLETLMNGAGGIQYYAFSSFESPLDFYYHARAMKAIAPHEEIILQGQDDPDITGSNKQFCYSRRVLGKQALLLVGNYNTFHPASTEIMLSEKRALDCFSGKPLQIQNGKLKLLVPADDNLLLLLEE